MPTYAWRCPTCFDVIPSDPKTWPMLSSQHRLVHALEERVEELVRILDPTPVCELDLEVVQA